MSVAVTVVELGFPVEPGDQVFVRPRSDCDNAHVELYETNDCSVIDDLVTRINLTPSRPAVCCLVIAIVRPSAEELAHGWMYSDDYWCLVVVDGYVGWIPALTTISYEVCRVSSAHESEGDCAG